MRLLLRILPVILAMLMASFVVAAEAQATNLVVNIVDNEDPIPLGGTITYSVTIENEDLPANSSPETTLRLSIPGTFTFTGTEGGSPITGCTPQPGTGPVTVICTVPPIAGGSAISLNALVKTSTQGVFFVSAAVPAALSANPSATQPTTVTDGTDLTLDVTGPASSASGSNVAYDFTVLNLGPMPATNVVVSVPIPAGLEDLVWPAGCVLSAGNYLCTIPGSVPVNGTAKLQLKGQIAVASNSDITVTGEITGSNPPDRITSNNRDTVTTDVTEGSDVKIAKSRSPSGTLLVGNLVTFTLTPRFTGETPFGLTIVDTLPGVYRVDSVTPAVGSGWTCDVAGQTVTCTLPSGGAPGHNVPLGPITIATTVVASGTATNTVNIASESPFDPNLANNTATDGGAIISENSADLRANKSTSANPVLEGTPFNFTISTSNLGNQPFTGTIVMTDSLPAGLRVDSYAALNGWTCSPAVPVTGPAPITCTRDYTAGAPLPVGATTPGVVLATVSTVSGATTFANSMTVTTVNPNFPDPNLVNNTVTINVNSTGAGDEADISVVKTALNPTIASGDIQQFAIEIVNAGSGASSTITFTDDLTGLINNKTGASNGFVQGSWTPNSATGMNCLPTALGGPTGTAVRFSCNIATLPVCTAGINCPVVQLTVRPGGNAGTRTNSAIAKSSVTYDPNLANNTGSASFNVTALADVTIGKTVNPSNPRAGQAFTYVLAATTTPDGRSAAENVTVTDTLPSGLIFLGAVPSSGSCSKLPTVGKIVDSPIAEQSTSGVLECNLGTIGSGAQRTVTVTVAATTALANTTVTNNAAVTSPTTPGDDPNNNSASVNANIQPPTLDLQISKVDTPPPEFGPDPIGIGSDMVYGLIVTNNGPSAAQDVVVTDTLPAGFLAYKSVSAPPGVICSGPTAGNVNCNIPLMLSGAVRVIKLTMTGTARGVAENVATLSSPEIAAGWDTNPLNNTDSESTTVRTRADVEVVSKTPSQSPVALFEPFSFEIKVRNNVGPGLSEADSVVLSDALPAGMKLVGSPTGVVTAGTTTANSCTGAAGDASFACSFGTMSSGAEVTVTAPVQVEEASSTQQVFTNTASVATISLEENTANNSNSGQVTVESTALAGLVFRDFNNNGVQDPGDSGIGGIEMTLTRTGGGTAVTFTVATTADGSYFFPAVPPGTYTVTRGTVDDPLLINGRAIPGSAGGSAVSAVAINGVSLSAGTATGYDFTLVPAANISISKALLAGPTVNPDGSFDATFRLTINNPSIQSLVSLVVTDQLAGGPPLFGSFAASPTQPGTYGILAAPSGSCGGLNAAFNGSSDKAVANGFTLDSSASCTVDFSIRVMPSIPLPPLQNGARYFNQASVAGQGGGTGEAVSSASQLVPLSPDLSQMTISKVLTGYQDKDGSRSITQDDVLSFKITATNTGSLPLTNVVVSDNRISPDSNACPVLQPGEICVLTGAYTVTLADVQAGAVVNTATADSDETNPITATVTTPVVAVVDKNTLTKTALVSTVTRGEKVPYVIVAEKVPFNPARIVDVMPPAFNYVGGSGVANGKKVEPSVEGRNLTFDGLVPDNTGKIKLELTLVATAAVNPGVAVNQAQLVDPRSGQVVATARARVTILAEAVFDCGDIIGKVFDDQNRNGYQDEGEPGLPAVRVATVGGLLITTDSNGRFNIPCADIPDADIGSNFIVKLDTRTLPTGYRVTTENPRRVRLTRGKVVKLNFGASISRLVKLELNGKVFEQGSAALLPKWEGGLDKLISALQAETSVLEITYRGSDGALAKARLRAVKNEIARRWQVVPDHYDLAIDTRIVSGGAP
ncbi:MAG: DUF11 domain-containing protein [Aestuariivirga sp.]|uniref:DUF7507 domain-containing protein n=1 Tax=Aestuariivirga sp. TaxID=2650926 RepID=UPI0025C28B96|nr:SdrD B-like domain-containing protein [Aestuariivirga sp.]MCA3561252.1 DUF11 domain-containing protein [Aestuariivirga sp.]